MKRSGGGPYRAGPWPGLTPAGARVLLACAAFLAVGQVLIGPPMRPLPDLAVIGATALLPLLVAVRLVRAPGAAMAVCGAYLLPASLVSLLRPSIPPPPLLLVPAAALELTLWLNATHFTAFTDLLPRREPPIQRPRAAAQGTPTRVRAALAGAAFGLTLAIVEPAYQVFLGSDPTLWTGPARWLALPLTAVVCAGLATLLSARGTASSRPAAPRR
jgi:hypothetical protein